MKGAPGSPNLPRRAVERTWAEKDGRPGFPVRCTGHDRMKLANATKLYRKSGVA
jgi:hypothetical protein